MVSYTLKNGATVDFYDDIKELPMYRLNAFQAALLQDAGMGSTLADIDLRFAKMDAFLAAGKTAEALQERQNMRFGLHFMLGGINTASACLAHLVAAVNGQPVPDTTDADVLNTARVLEAGGLTTSQVHGLAHELKKKLTAESSYTFLN